MAEHFYNQEMSRYKKEFRQERQMLVNAVFLIASGALTLSAGFVSNTERKFVCILLLIISWAFLLVSLILQVTSLVYSKKEILDYVFQLKEWKEQSFKYSFVTNSRAGETATALHWMSFIALISGLLFLVIFAGVNVYLWNH